MKVCQLEPTTVVKEPEQRCRHHTFTTGWLEDESLSDLDLKVKALSERCMEARRLMRQNLDLMNSDPLDVDYWLAGEDE